jgi:CPA2 family monovalent cation:H+ antiporter-2
MAIGPYGMAWIPDSESTRALAEFGVVFLMFTLGLEFSLAKLLSMRREVLGLGSAQVIITTTVVGSIAWLMEFSVPSSIIIGGIFALSSTAIVIKQLEEQLELNSRHGRLAIGILLFQDIAVIPFLILIPALNGTLDNNVALEMTYAFVKGIIVVILMFALGHYALRPLFHEIVKVHSSELFTLAVLLFVVTAAWVTHTAGLSLALGAFLAGMMLGETQFRHQVEADIRPFRDVLLGLFFVTIGMMLNVLTLPEIWPWVLLTVAGVAVLKIVLIMLMSMGAGAEMGVAMRTGITLAPGGEFGFALISLAVAANVLNTDSSQIVLASIVLSMMIGPTLIRYNGTIAKKLCAGSYRQSRLQVQQNIEASTEKLHEHVIILGYGRIGQNIARFLKAENIPYVALDLDPVGVNEAREAGDSVLYGDSSHSNILEAAGIRRARVLVISFDDTRATRKILPQVKRLRPDLPVLVRTRDDTHLEEFQRLGAKEIIPETLEASLTLASHLLLLLDVPAYKISQHVQKVRDSRYAMLRQFFHGRNIADVDEPNRVRESLHSVLLNGTSYAIGKTLQEINLGKCAVTVTAIRHVDGTIVEPKLDEPFSSGDVLVLFGTPENLEKAEDRLLMG